MHLRELGIRSAQGYVFAPPLPGKAFLQLVEAMDALPASVAAAKAASVGAAPKAEPAEAKVSAQVSAA
jgi:hypothetical protein